MATAPDTPAPAAHPNTIITNPTLATIGKELDLGQNPSDYRRLFDEWYEHHRLLATATGVADEKQILNLLLLWGGKGLRRFATEAGVIQGGGDTLQAAIEKIRAKTGSFVNLSMSVYNLMHVDQGSKAVTTYAREVEELAQQCQFDTQPYTKDRAMRDAFIFGTSDQKLRRDALAQDISYSQLLKTALSYEQSRKAAEEMTAEEVSKVSIAGKYSGRRNNIDKRDSSRFNRDNRNSGPPTQGQGRQRCPNCPPHYRPHEPNRCPAAGKTCVACNKKGHFAGSSRCTAKNTQKVRAVEADSDNDNEDYAFGVYTVNCLPINSVSTYTTVTVKFNDSPIKISVDSQCKYTIIPKHFYTKNMGAIKQSNIKFKPYGTNYKLKTLGVFNTKIITSNGASTNTQVFIVEGEGHTQPLLGEIDSVALGILNIDKGGKPEIAQITTNSEHLQQTSSETKKQQTRIGIKEKLEIAGFKVQNIQDGHQNMTPKGRETLNETIAKYKDVFKGIGKLKDQKVKFNIDNNVEPKVAPYRPVPIAYQKSLSDHLETLRQSGKIEDVPRDTHTGWVSNVVITEKKNKSIRMNIDMREANKALKHTPRHVETVQEIRHRMKGAKFFTEMDMSHGFHQLQLAEESQAISTFRTHEGLHKFKVLFFGAAPASDIFHDTIKAALEGLKGCASIHDNIIVWGDSEEEHNNNLEACLKRLKERGLTLRLEKCNFGKTSISWFGWKFNPSGMSADPEKIRAIKEAGKPQSNEEVKSFLQAVQFNARFMVENEQAYAQMSLPLRQLTHKNARFIWTTECEEAYQKIIKAMSADTALRYFDPSKNTILITDASEIGIAATVYQEEENKVLKPVDHASRSLTSTEQRYSAIERESLGQAWGMETHRYYLLGREFDTYTDHEPLLHIYNGKKKGNSRVERHRIKTQGFRYKMKHIKGKLNPCDYASRHPLNIETLDPRKTRNIDNGQEICISQLLTEDLPHAITLKEIKEETKKDKSLQELITAIKRGYPSNAPSLRPYRNIFTELSHEAGIVMRGDRLVIPNSLQRPTVCAAHEGHQGEVKTKQLLRTRCWFPNMNALVQEEVSSCRGCQATTYVPTRDPLKPTMLPKAPWQKLDSDFKGPLPGGEYLLVVIDEYTRYPEVEITKSTAAKHVLPSMDRIFATHGFPETLKTDGGPPFNGNESHSFQQYMKWAGVKHITVSPEDPEANGLAENFMKNLKKIWNIALIEKKNPHQELYQYLRQYRATPHTTTGKAPAELLFGRPYQTRLPRRTEATEDRELRERDGQQKEKQKAYKDKPNNVKEHRIKYGDKVLLLNRKKKGPFWYDPDPYTVTKIQGHQITAKRGHQMMRRDAKNFKVITQKQQLTKKNKGLSQQNRNEEVDMLLEPQPQVETPREHQQNGQEETETNHIPPTTQTTEPTWVRRSTRSQRKTNKYNAAKGKWQ